MRVQQSEQFQNRCYFFVKVTTLVSSWEGSLHNRPAFASQLHASRHISFFAASSETPLPSSTFD